MTKKLPVVKVGPELLDVGKLCCEKGLFLPLNYATLGAAVDMPGGDF
jgi:hypothetical protein